MYKSAANLVAFSRPKIRKCLLLAELFFVEQPLAPTHFEVFTPLPFLIAFSRVLQPIYEQPLHEQCWELLHEQCWELLHVRPQLFGVYRVLFQAPSKTKFREIGPKAKVKTAHHTMLTGPALVISMFLLFRFFCLLLQLFNRFFCSLNFFDVVVISISVCHVCILEFLFDSLCFIQCRQFLLS